MIYYKLRKNNYLYYLFKKYNSYILLKRLINVSQGWWLPTRRP